jgi:leucine dehydrogenase
VAYYLCRHLHAEGAKLIVTDIDAEKVKRAVEEFGARAVAPDAIYDQKADIYAPCALGATINDDTLNRLKVEIIAGGANNQLATPEDGDRLHARGILYAPDYAVNAGGVMNVSLEIDGYNRERAMRLMRNIYHTLGKVYELADREGITPQYAADRIAEARIASIGKLKLPLGRTAPRFMGHLRGEH